MEREWKENYEEHRARARYSSHGGDYAGVPPTRSALEVSEEERNEIYERGWAKNAFTLLRSFTDISTNREANETLAEFVRNKIRQTVSDPQVAELLCPKDYPLGAKRICRDTNYYETFNRENVTLVDVKTNPIEEITPGGLRTTAESYELDVLVFATGFDALTGPLIRMGIVGRGGVPLSEKWRDGPSGPTFRANREFSCPTSAASAPTARSVRKSWRRTTRASRSAEHEARSEATTGPSVSMRYSPGASSFQMISEIPSTVSLP
jgi:cation diffusion facilitator CzcD-associated flavoprotein CzcO